MLPRTAVAVVDEEPRSELLVVKPHHHIPRLLLDPPIVGMIRGRTEKHPALADMNEREALRDPDDPAGRVAAFVLRSVFAEPRVAGLARCSGRMGMIRDGCVRFSWE